MNYPNAPAFPIGKQRILTRKPIRTALPNANPDGDESVNFLEFIEQTHPLVPNHGQQIRVRTSKENVEIQFRQLPNRLYEVQWTDALASPTLWQPLAVSENRPLCFRLALLENSCRSPAAPKDEILSSNCHRRLLTKISKTVN